MNNIALILASLGIISTYFYAKANVNSFLFYILQPFPLLFPFLTAIFYVSGPTTLYNCFIIAVTFTILFIINCVVGSLSEEGVI